MTDLKDLAELDNKKLLTEKKVHLVKNLANSNISKIPLLSDKLLKTFNSDEFNLLSDKTQNIILDFVFDNKIPLNQDIKINTLSGKEKINFTGPLENLSLSKSVKVSGSNVINNLLYSYKEVGTDVKLSIMPQSTTNKIDLLSSKLDMTIAPFSKEKVNSIMDSIANKIAVSASQSETKYKPADLKDIVKSAVNRIYEKERIDKMNNFTVTLNSSSDILSVNKIYKQIDKTRLDPTI